MSPSIDPPDEEGWHRLVALRRETIDAAVAERRWLDLALMGALGEPPHWMWTRDHRSHRYHGASQWQMITPNAGKDLVRDRLHRLAFAVAARDHAAVRGGLEGASIRDEVGDDAVDSRTGTGLCGVGPVDNAIAWCALWGIGLLAVAARIDRPSQTAGHAWRRSIDGRRSGWFHLPVVSVPVTVSRLRTILASGHLLAVATTDGASIAVETSRRWLLEHQVSAIVQFPIAVLGSANAPERRALAGDVQRVRLW